jgi:uncharacterized protein
MLDDYGTLTQEQIINKYKDQADPTEVANTLKILETTIYKDKIFSNHRPAALKFAESQASIKHNLSTQLSRLVLNITEQCNMRCKYCSYSGKYPYERVHQNQHMTLETAKKAVDFYLLHSCQDPGQIIGFYGGEPLLNFNVIRGIVYYTADISKKKNVYFKIETNGTLLNQNIIDFFIENNFIISISLDGPREIHDQNRILKNGRGSFDTVIRKLTMIKNRDKDYYNRYVRFMITIVQPDTFLEVEQFFSSFDLMTEQIPTVTYVDSKDTTFFRSIDSVELWKLKIKNEQNKLKNELYQLLINGGSAKGKPVMELFDLFLIAIVTRSLSPLSDVYCPPRICVPGLVELFVNVKGKFFICESFGEHFCIGDVNNGFDFDAIFKLLETWRSLNETECLNCWALRLCKLCWVHARKGDELALERMRKSCKNMRESLDIYLSFYASVMEKNPSAFDFLKTLSDQHKKFEA